RRPPGPDLRAEPPGARGQPQPRLLGSQPIEPALAGQDRLRSLLRSAAAAAGGAHSRAIDQPTRARPPIRADLPQEATALNIDRSEIAAAVAAVLVVFAPAIHRLGVDGWLNLDLTQTSVLVAIVDA